MSKFNRTSPTPGSFLQHVHRLLMNEARDVRITCGEGDFDHDIVSGHLDALHEPKGENVTAEARVADVAEGGADVLFGGHGVGDTISPSLLMQLCKRPLPVFAAAAGNATRKKNAACFQAAFVGEMNLVSRQIRPSERWRSS
jgi:hypothetical protein